MTSEAAALRAVPSAPVRVPQHVGIIMDGNGRWAERRNLPRGEGHRRGVESLRKTVRAVGDHGIRYLTLFAFSSENWKRPKAEVSELLRLLRLFVRKDLVELKANGVKVRIIGERDSLSEDLKEVLTHAEDTTRAGTNLHLNIAFNYGGRDEIVRAVRKISRAVADGTLEPGAVTEAMLSAHLDTVGMPDPDLIIRTSGEERLSNFLLWQAAYAEFVFSQTLWPDFDEACLTDALAQYSSRERRFGGRDANVQAAAL